MSDANVVEPLPPGLASALEAPGAHPLDPTAAAGIECIQTHLSHVYLTRNRVYKVRKAVALPFVSFASRAERNADCLREVALNRRLAPDVYLGVAPIEATSDGFRVGAPRETLAENEKGLPEHCVVMRRLPEARNAQVLLETDQLDRRDLDAAARLLADFHADHPFRTHASREAWWDQVWIPVSDALDLCDVNLAGEANALAARVRELARSRFAARRDAIDARRRAGRIVDGHGDLQLGHLWFEVDAKPVAIDCVEFRDDFRRADAASEVAFLTMDLRYRGRTDLANHFLDRYARRSGDYTLFDVVDFFSAYRAAVRAGVAAVASQDAGIDAAQRERAVQSAVAHLERALDDLRDPAPGTVVAVCGLVGSGKSTVAAEVARITSGIAIASDVTRKQLAGLSETDRGEDHPELDLYSDPRTEAVYAAQLERAEGVVASGRTAVLDATHSLRQQRDAVRRWAAERGAVAWLVHVRCGEAETLRRLAARARERRDASDAGPDLLPRSRARFEAPTEWPGERRIDVATDREEWREALARDLAALAGVAPASGG